MIFAGAGKKTRHNKIGQGQLDTMLYVIKMESLLKKQTEIVSDNHHMKNFVFVNRRMRRQRRLEHHK